MDGHDHQPRQPAQHITTTSCMIDESEKLEGKEMVSEDIPYLFLLKGEHHWTEIEAITYSIVYACIYLLMI